MDLASLLALGLLAQVTPPTPEPWHIDAATIMGLVNSVLMLLVALGIIKLPTPPAPGPTTTFDAWLTANGFDPATVNANAAQRALLYAQWQATVTPGPAPSPVPSPTPQTPIISSILAILVQLLPLFTKSAGGGTLTFAENTKLESLSAEVDTLAAKVEKTA